MRRAASLCLIILALAITLTACGSSQPSLSSATRSVLASDNFTIVDTFLQTGDEPTPETGSIVINNPDRIALGTNANSRDYQLVGIGSTTYTLCQGTWSATRYPEGFVSSGIQQDLWLLHVVAASTMTNIRGSTYVVPPKEAAGLLRSPQDDMMSAIRLIKGNDVSLSATVRDGLLRTVTLDDNAQNQGGITEKLMIIHVGSSPTITAPKLPKGSTVPFQEGIATKIPTCSAG